MSVFFTTVRQRRQHLPRVGRSLRGTLTTGRYTNRLALTLYPSKLRVEPQILRELYLRYLQRRQTRHDNAVIILVLTSPHFQKWTHLTSPPLASVHRHGHQCKFGESQDKTISSRVQALLSLFTIYVAAHTLNSPISKYRGQVY